MQVSRLRENGQRARLDMNRHGFAVGHSNLIIDVVVVPAAGSVLQAAGYTVHIAKPADGCAESASHAHAGNGMSRQHTRIGLVCAIDSSAARTFVSRSPLNGL